MPGNPVALFRPSGPPAKTDRMTGSRLEIPRSEQTPFRCVGVRQRTLGGGFHVHRPQGRGLPLCSQRFDPGLREADNGQLASLTGRAERAFSDSIHAKIGRIRPRFVNVLQVGHARVLLADSALPLAEVARACGY